MSFSYRRKRHYLTSRVTPLNKEGRYQSRERLGIEPEYEPVSGPGDRHHQG